MVCGGLCPNGARSFFALELGAGECGGGTGEQVGAGGGGPSQAVVAHTFNPKWEAEAGGFLSSRPA